MTEQEIKRRIDDCDRKMASAYNNLRGAARDVGWKGYQAAKSESQSVISWASSNKTKKTLLPLIISAVGLFIFGASWLLGLAMIIVGIGIAYNQNQKADKELRSVRSSYNQMVSMAENQQRNLESILDNITKI